MREASFEMISAEAEKVLGYPSDDITFPFLLQKVHPDDIPYLLNFEKALAEFFVQLPVEKRGAYKIQYDFRLQRRDGIYIRILNQMVIVQFSSSSNDIRTFGVQADISHLNRTGIPSLAFVALEDSDPSYYNVGLVPDLQPRPGYFSTREKEVLRLMLDGLVSKEIADRLSISKHTVDTHRKHLLEKTRSRSIPEMVKKSIVNGWI